jgi:N-acetylglucosamine kinase
MPKSGRIRCVAGVDAGGTHTRCCVADTTGRLLSYGFGGPANRLFVSRSSAQRAVEAALTKALEPCSGKLEALVLAGPHLSAGVLGAIPGLAPKERIIATDEFELSLAAGLGKPGGAGVVVAAGTGSFCKGRDAKGTVGYSGGWGPLIGDEGSGYDIAREALAAIARAHDARGEKTLLTEMIFWAVGIHEIQELKAHLYDPPIKRHECAALARCVFDAADKRDKIAIGILESAGLRLAQLAGPVVTRLFGPDERFPVILTGGVMRDGSVLVRALAAEMKEMRRSADVFVSPLQPVTGALIIGLDSIGVRIDTDIINNLKETDAGMKIQLQSMEKTQI